MDETAILDSQHIADEFMETVYADPEWVDAEFESIIADFWEAPTATSTPPQPVHRGRPERVTCTRLRGSRPAGPVTGVAAKVRSPPPVRHHLIFSSSVCSPDHPPSPTVAGRRRATATTSRVDAA